MKNKVIAVVLSLMFSPCALADSSASVPTFNKRAYDNLVQAIPSATGLPSLGTCGKYPFFNELFEHGHSLEEWKGDIPSYMEEDSLLNDLLADDSKSAVPISCFALVNSVGVLFNQLYETNKIGDWSIVEAKDLKNQKGKVQELIKSVLKKPGPSHLLGQPINVFERNYILLKTFQKISRVWLLDLEQKQADEQKIRDMKSHVFGMWFVLFNLALIEDDGGINNLMGVIQETEGEFANKDFKIPVHPTAFESLEEFRQKYPNLAYQADKHKLSNKKHK